VVLKELQAMPWWFDAKERTMRKRLALTSLTLLVLVGSAALLGACKAIEKSADENKGY
jgi:hypothetical protein